MQAPRQQTSRPVTICRRWSRASTAGRCRPTSSSAASAPRSH